MPSISLGRRLRLRPSLGSRNQRRESASANTSVTSIRAGTGSPAESGSEASSERSEAPTGAEASTEGSGSEVSSGEPASEASPAGSASMRAPPSGGSRASSVSSFGTSGHYSRQAAGE